MKHLHFHICLISSFILLMISMSQAVALPSDNCISVANATAGLPHSYAAETFEEAEKFPDLLQAKSKAKINSAGWWGDEVRTETTKDYVKKLKAEVKAGMRRLRKLKRLVSRQTRSIDQQIGTCYPRNSVTADGVFRICAECSSRRDLGADKIPRYLNEMICDPSVDVSALSGEGLCIQKGMDITVQKRHDNGTFAEESASLGTGCEFRMYQGSVLINLNTNSP